jgi:hypothetical protein
VANGFRRKPLGVASNATREPPLIPYFLRNAAGMVTRPRVENLTLKFLFKGFIGAPHLPLPGFLSNWKMRFIVRGSDPKNQLPYTQFDNEAAMYHATKKCRPAFAIFTQTICQGIVPAWRDERGFPVLYESEKEAQKEVAEMIIEHLQQFIADEREFEDAITTEDFILPVDVWPDGTISTEDGHRFGPSEP